MDLERGRRKVTHALQATLDKIQSYYCPEDELGQRGILEIALEFGEPGPNQTVQIDYNLARQKYFGRRGTESSLRKAISRLHEGKSAVKGLQVESKRVIVFSVDESER